MQLEQAATHPFSHVVEDLQLQPPLQLLIRQLIPAGRRKKDENTRCESSGMVPLSNIVQLPTAGRWRPESARAACRLLETCTALKLRTSSTCPPAVLCVYNPACLTLLPAMHSYKAAAGPAVPSLAVWPALALGEAVGVCIHVVNVAAHLGDHLQQPVHRKAKNSARGMHMHQGSALPAVLKQRQHSKASVVACFCRNALTVQHAQGKGVTRYAPAC